MSIIGMGKLTTAGPGKIEMNSDWRNVFNHSYTKEDALSNQFGRQFLNITLEDAANGRFDMQEIGDLGLRYPFSTQEHIDAYQKVLEEQGLGDEIYWNGVLRDFDVVATVKEYNADYIKSKVDYIASRYAVLKDRIYTDYSGEEREGQLVMLDQLYSQARSQLADSYSEVVGKFMEENGASGETENLRTSVLSAVDERAKQYSTYIQDNKDYAKIQSEKDQWLLRDDGYMAAQLRVSMNEQKNPATLPETSNGNKTASYSLHDLEIAGMYMTQITPHYGSADVIGSSYSEESIGLDLATQGMKMKHITKNSGIGDSMGSLLNRMFEGYMERYIDRLNEGLKKLANHPATQSKQEFAPLDKGAIYEIYQYTMDKYHESGDMMKALIAGAEYGKAQYDQKAGSEEYGPIGRYQGNSPSALKWDNFFSIGTSKNEPYNCTLSQLQKYAISFNHFMESVSKGNIYEIDLMFALNGNLSTDKVDHTYLELHAETENFYLKTQA